MKNLSRLNKYILKYKWSIVFGLLFVFMVTSFEIPGARACRSDRPCRGHLCRHPDLLANPDGAHRGPARHRDQAACLRIYSVLAASAFRNHLAIA